MCLYSSLSLSYPTPLTLLSPLPIPHTLLTHPPSHPTGILTLETSKFIKSKEFDINKDCVAAYKAILEKKGVVL
jgi:hypothetical protein